jgi:hypothetical protein
MVISERRAAEEFGWENGCETGPPVAEYEVDLDALHPVARLMAGQVETTNNLDPRSLVRIRRVPSRRELDERHGVVLPRRRDGRGSRPDGVFITTWRWSRPLQCGETPERYFEQQAREMLGAGFVLEELSDSWACRPCGAMGQAS